MKICFRQVTQHDLDKFPLWYRRIQGKDLFTHFIPTSFRSFEEEIDLIWRIILADDEEIGTIWFERKDKSRSGYALGIYLNRVELFGKGIGRRAIKLAIDNILKGKDVDEFYLDVRKKNTRAIRCYERLGFVTIQDGKKTTDYGTIEFHRMILKIQTESRGHPIVKEKKIRSCFSGADESKKVNCVPASATAQHIEASNTRDR